MQIDIDPLAAGRTYESLLYLHGDSRLVLEGLVERLRTLEFSADPALAADLAKARSDAQRAYAVPRARYVRLPPHGGQRFAVRRAKAKEPPQPAGVGADEPGRPLPPLE